MTEFAERLKVLIGEESANAFARRVGLGESLLRKYLAGSIPSIDKARELAERSGVNFLWLATGEGPMRGGSEQPQSHAVATAFISSLTNLPPELAADFALVPRLDIKASAGNGALAIDEEVIDFLAFQASWLRSRHINPDRARVMTAKGDSMEPTIRDGDVLLVDTSIDRVRDNALYIIVFEGLVFVKRIHMKLDGSILLISDNQLYPPESVTADAAPRLHVAGRVVWFGRSI